MEAATGKKYEEVHFVDSTKPVWNYSLFTDEDIRNFQNGTHYSIYELMGSHRVTVLGVDGYYFAVWAPNATAVSVIGNFNQWAPEQYPLFVRLDRSGIWEGFIPHFKTHVENLTALLAQVASGKGVTLAPNEVSQLAHPQAVFIPLAPPVPSVISAAAQRKEAGNLLLQELLACCQKNRALPPRKRLTTTKRR